MAGQKRTYDVSEMEADKEAMHLVTKHNNRDFLLTRRNVSPYGWYVHVPTIGASASATTFAPSATAPTGMLPSPTGKTTVKDGANGRPFIFH